MHFFSFFSLPCDKLTVEGSRILFLTKTNKTLAVMQGLHPLFLLWPRLAPKQASASRGQRRNSLRSSGLHHSKKNLENKPERS